VEQGIQLDEQLAERLSVARRSLRALPDDMLVALACGLRRHADELLPGRLYSAQGGCPVGVMLRQLDPEAYSGGRLRFALRHGWRRRAGWYGGELARNPRLRHLEWSFDEAVERTRELDPALSRRQAAAVVGAWIRADAEAELDWRRVQGESWRLAASPDEAFGGEDAAKPKGAVA
jgi:hypothetical protein